MTADVALVTSLRDGMNLVSYEYVACQNQNKGVLVLSEVSRGPCGVPVVCPCRHKGAMLLTIEQGRSGFCASVR